MKKIPMLDLRREYAHMKTDIDTALQRCFGHQQWILGPEVGSFESAFAEYLGVKHCIGVSSGTDALVLALRAQAILKTGREYFTRDDQVITTPFTFTATGDAIIRSGATPVFVDIDESTFNIDTREVLDYMAGYGDRVAGIVPVHLFGRSADMDEVTAMAGDNGCFVLEDVAQACGAAWKGIKTGALGDSGAFSFFPSKNLGCCGDGGMVATNDDAVAELIRMLLKHGGRDKYNVSHIGYNARIDTLQAGILLAKLPYLDGFNERRRRIAAIYQEELSGFGGDALVLPAVDDTSYHVYHQYTVRSPRRDELKAYLSARGIESMIYYPCPLHAMEVFRERMVMWGSLEKSQKAASEVLSLPIEPLQDDDDTRRVADAVRDYFEGR